MNQSTPQVLEPAPMSRPTPIIERERIAAIDSLRGVAVLGILLMNIQSFAMPDAAYMNPTAYGDLRGLNYWVWYFCHLLADQKFMTIFSMLFGAGIVLMTSRIEASGRGSAGVHYRRMAWLILFGILHAHLLWYGDILYFYGMCGLVAWPFRRLHPAILIPLGLVIISVASLISLAGGLSLEFWDPAQIETFNNQFHPPDDVIAEEIASYRGDWFQQLEQRFPSAVMFEVMLFLIWGSWRAGGLMLIGMGLHKLGAFSAKAPSWVYAVMIGSGVLIGLPIVAYGIYRNEQEHWAGTYSVFFGSQYNYWASVLVSLAWIGAVMLAYRAGKFSWLMRRFAAVGRMALSNYLLHTVICTTIFYGHGFGLFGQSERKHQLLIVLGIWIIQLIMSPIWLSHFQFGPAEWLWRTLTYWRWQPFRRRSDHPAGQQLVHSQAG